MFTDKLLAEIVSQRPDEVRELLTLAREFREAVNIHHNPQDYPYSERQEEREELLEKTSEKLLEAIVKFEHVLAFHIPDLKDHRIFPYPFSEWRPDKYQAQKKGLHVFEFYSEKDCRFSGRFEASNMVEATTLLKKYVDDLVTKHNVKMPDDIKFRGWEW